MTKEARFYLNAIKALFNPLEINFYNIPVEDGDLAEEIFDVFTKNIMFVYKIFYVDHLYYIKYIKKTGYYETVNVTKKNGCLITQQMVRQ